MPMIPGFAETMTKLVELHKKKNDDYSGDKGPFFNFNFCEYVSSLFQHSKDKVYAVFIAVKIARLSVVLSAKTVNNESIEDTFDDLIVYANIWKCDVMARNQSVDLGKQVTGTLTGHKIGCGIYAPIAPRCTCKEECRHEMRFPLQDGVYHCPECGINYKP